MSIYVYLCLSMSINVCQCLSMSVYQCLSINVYQSSLSSRLISVELMWRETWHGHSSANWNLMRNHVTMCVLLDWLIFRTLFMIWFDIFNVVIATTVLLHLKPNQSHLQFKPQPALPKTRSPSRVISLWTSHRVFKFANCQRVWLVYRPLD